MSWIDGSGYVVSLPDRFNGVRRNLLACSACRLGCRASGSPREAVPLTVTVANRTGNA
jgi:hypothetical protein